MMLNKSIKAVAVSAAVFGAGAASAATVTVDFTDSGAYATQTAASASGQVGTDNGTWKASGSDDMTFTRYDGDAAAPGLASQIDGIGVLDDEISFPKQTVTVSFSEAYRVTGLHFLDVFGGESVLVWLNGIGAALEFNATEAADDNSIGGYLFAKIDAIVTSLTFASGDENDTPLTRGNPDIALAGIDFASRDGQEPEPVPLPAGGLLLLTALAGLGAARKAKK